MTAEPLDFELLPTAEEIEDERARRSLLAFTLRTHHGYKTNPHNIYAAERLDAFARFQVPHLIIVMPPRRGKSELASRRLPAYMFGLHPDISIIATSHTDNLAKSMNRDVQRIMMSKRYARIFPRTRIGVSETGERWKRTAHEFEVVNRRGKYMSMGIGGGLAGFGGNARLIDDPYKNRKDANSEAYRNDVWNFFNDDLRAREELPSCELVMATRWHVDDLIGRCLREEGNVDDGGLWEVVHFPEIQDELDRDYDPRPIGRSLWPVFYQQPWEHLADEEPPDLSDFPDIADPVLVTLDDLEARAQLAFDKRKGKGDVHALWQGRPVPPGGNIIKTEWTDYRFKTMSEDIGEFLIACDPKGGSKDPASSKCAIQLWWRSYANPGIIRCIDSVKGLWDLPETIAVFRKLLGLETHRPVRRDTDTDELIYVTFDEDFEEYLSALAVRPTLAFWSMAKDKVIEDKADGKAIVATLRSELPGFQLFNPRGAKEVRWRAVAPFWRSGNVLLPVDDFPAAVTWLQDFIDEHTAAPAWPNDDQIDTSSMVLLWWFVDYDPEESGWDDWGLDED